MLNLFKIISIFSLLALSVVSCNIDTEGGASGGSAGDDATGGSGDGAATSGNDDSLAANLDFMIRTSCAYYDVMDDYPSNTLRAWRGKVLYEPKSFNSQIINDSGNVLQSIKRLSGTGSGRDQANLGKYPEVVAKARNEVADLSIYSIIRSNIDNNILATCEYADKITGEVQKYSIIIPLKVRDAWRKSRSYAFDSSFGLAQNDLFFHISFLSDLRYKIYLKEYLYTGNQTTALKNSEIFMDGNFPNSTYSEKTFTEYGVSPVGYGNHKIPSIFEGKNSIQVRYYRQQKLLAEKYTGDSVEQLNNTIAENYESYYLSNNGCIDDYICSTYFSGYSHSVTSDPSFLSGQQKWNSTDNLLGDAEAIYLSEKNKVGISFSVNSLSSQESSMAEISQKYYLNHASELNKLILDFSTINTYGGSYDPILGSLLSSGMAGYYVCFNDIDTVQLGCPLWLAYTDKIQIPTYIGQLFSVTSTDNMHIFFYPPNNSKFIIDLEKEISRNLPNLVSKKSSIKSISYGVFTTESRGGGQGCYKCNADIKTSEINLKLAN